MDCLGSGTLHTGGGAAGGGHRRRLEAAWASGGWRRVVGGATEDGGTQRLAKNSSGQFFLATTKFGVARAPRPPTLDLSKTNAAMKGVNCSVAIAARVANTVRYAAEQRGWLAEEELMPLNDMEPDEAFESRRRLFGR